MTNNQEEKYTIQVDLTDDPDISVSRIYYNYILYVKENREEC